MTGDSEKFEQNENVVGSYRQVFAHCPFLTWAVWNGHVQGLLGRNWHGHDSWVEI